MAWWEFVARYSGATVPDSHGVPGHLAATAGWRTIPDTFKELGDPASSRPILASTIFSPAENCLWIGLNPSQVSSRSGRINRFELACPSGHHPGETMPNPTTASGIRDNHRRGVVADFLTARIYSGSRQSVTSADFTF